MATTATTTNSASSGFFSALRTADVQLALGMIGIVLMMILPLPPMAIDLLLTVSISIGFMILLIAIYVKEPLDFSTFPTLLLVTTLFRLSLNVATTRNILLEGATGHVSDVVKSFGNFVVGGNYFVGFVIFMILIIINFIVITKGAGRVAEVAARFTLDAMPGKQMAIDAEMNAGIIDREEAKKRRSKIEQEADFYGAMDGASKFVRGDAIAGLIITAVNIIVGLILGVVRHNLTFAQSAQTFTLLTVGEGLVSQIPALIISTAAGIVVTRATSEGALSEELHNQIIVHPKAMFVCSGLLVGMSVVPGLPTIPFLMLSAGFYGLGRVASRYVEKKAADAASAEEAKKAPVSATDTIDQALHIDTLAIEVAFDLVPLVDPKQGGEVLQRIISTRKQIAGELGIVTPQVMVRDNMQLRQGEYQILLKGNRIGGGFLMIDHHLAMIQEDPIEPLDGHKTVEPAYQLPALWIRSSQKAEAEFRGYTVVNCATVVVTHLAKLIRDHAQELVGRQELSDLVEGMRKTHPKVVEEVIAPDRMSLGDVVKVLQNLLAEGVSIRDLLSVFEALADHCKTVRHPDALTRYARKALTRTIVRQYLTPEDSLVYLTLDRAVEDVLVGGLQVREDGQTSLSIDPELAQRILNNIANSVSSFQTTGTQPVILCGSRIRWDLKKLIGQFIPNVVVIAFDELPPGIQTQSIGIVTL
jgi:flagellar biosynthesis protein FlhA